MMTASDVCPPLIWLEMDDLLPLGHQLVFNPDPSVLTLLTTERGIVFQCLLGENEAHILIALASFYPQEVPDQLLIRALSVPMEKITLEHLATSKTSGDFNAVRRALLSLRRKISPMQLKILRMVGSGYILKGLKEG